MNLGLIFKEFIQPQYNLCILIKFLELSFFRVNFFPIYYLSMWLLHQTKYITFYHLKNQILLFKFNQCQVI